MTPGHPLWSVPLSGRSQEFSGRQDPETGNWTIGDYFYAARSFVSRGQVLERMMSVLGPEVGPPEGWDVSLNLEKHGAFYHPIKITVRTPGVPGKESFVLNGAVSIHGRELARRESRLLSLMEQMLPFPAAPRVYMAGEVSRPQGMAGFLLAQWLEGFHEFHVTEERDRREIGVWRPGKETLYLPLEKALLLYENIAEILTLAYDPESGGQVLFWHHGAGDFIVNPEEETLPVKMITVREYGLMFDDAILAQGPMPGLLFFFLNLSLRMQMDRLDGIGATVFLGPEVLTATVKGFFKGLRNGDKGGETAEAVWKFLGEFSADQIRMVLEQMTEAWPPGPSERGLVAGKIAEFAGQIRGLLKTGRFSDFY